MRVLDKGLVYGLRRSHMHTCRRTHTLSLAGVIALVSETPVSGSITESLPPAAMDLECGAGLFSKRLI